MYRREAAQVVTFTPSGGNARWLGTIGSVTGLKYSFTLPGGDEAMSCQLAVPTGYRTDAIDPGRLVHVTRGASVVWSGKLNEPAPSDAGWDISAKGIGTFGDDYQAVYSSWTANDPVNQAISRGLQWKNPGISGGFLEQEHDSGSQSITDFLNMLCSPGSKTWYIDRNGFLRVVNIPTTPTRQLIATSPPTRTLAGYVDVLYIRYQASADTDNSTATYGLTSVTNSANISRHGRMEAFWDLSSAGTLGASTAQSFGQQALAKYTAASYAGPFSIQYGQYLNMGGAPVDLGCERAGEVCTVMLTDGAYGGEVSPAPPISFAVGKFEYDDLTEQASITPFQSIQGDLSSFLSAIAAQLAKPSATG